MAALVDDLHRRSGGSGGRWKKIQDGQRNSLAIVNIGCSKQICDDDDDDDDSAFASDS